MCTFNPKASLILPTNVNPEFCNEILLPLIFLDNNFFSLALVLSSMRCERVDENLCKLNGKIKNERNFKNEANAIH
jgi:hypothetical protein